jgi:membrane protein DedA with SNARE-associated domain/uncharacterized tellurite resistance protein B-like protein
VIESLIHWLAGLPPVAVYGVLALLAAVENVIPPVPSDAAVALGAFLSHRGVTRPLLVFLVTWTANMLGAALVYLAARRFGRRLFATRTGRRLLAPRSLAVIEREYLRFGVAGIFLSRFLPGIRAVVPPFAGLVRLGAVRTFVPMAAASAIWYGGITLMGSVLGAQWQRILSILEGVNRTMGIVTVVLLALAGLWYWRSRRRRAHERLWHVTREALDPAAPSFLEGTEIAEGSAREAAALLVLELAYADPVLTREDRELVAGHVRDRWGLGAARPVTEPPPEEERRTRFADYAGRLRERFGRAQRIELVERMWSVAFGDGAIGAIQEARVMAVAAELLGLGPAEVAEVRRKACEADAP